METQTNNAQEHLNSLNKEIEVSSKRLGEILSNIDQQNKYLIDIQETANEIHEQFANKAEALKELNIEINSLSDKSAKDSKSLRDSIDSLRQTELSLNTNINTLTQTKEDLDKSVRDTLDESEKQLAEIEKTRQTRLKMANDNIEEANRILTESAKKKQDAEQQSTYLAKQIEEVRKSKEEELLNQTKSLEDLKANVVSVLSVLKDRESTLDQREASIKEIEANLVKKL